MERREFLRVSAPGVVGAALASRGAAALPVNVQIPGYTLAITGPWHRGPV